jgi:hypothetical protein
MSYLCNQQLKYTNNNFTFNNSLRVGLGLLPYVKK